MGSTLNLANLMKLLADPIGKDRQIRLESSFVIHHRTATSDTSSSMSLYWIYNVSTPILGVIIMSMIVFPSILGLLASRSLVRHYFVRHGAHNDITSYYFAAVILLNALILGQVMVVTYGNYVISKGKTETEASSIIALFNELDSYPHPLKTNLVANLTTYVRFIIESDWPAHRDGQVPKQGSLILDQIEGQILDFEPRTESHRILHSQVIETFEEVVENRAARIQIVNNGLPAILWFIIIFGAFISITTSYLFIHNNTRLHVFQVAALSTAISLVIFVTAAMDNPFRGDISVTTDSYNSALEFARDLQLLDR
jgi:hypothetical protein